MASKDRSEVSLILKYVLFAANFLFFIVGGVAWCFGAWSISIEPVDIRSVTDFLFNPRIIVMMFIGLATFLIAFFGCCGSLREIRGCLKCYYFTIGICLILELIVLTFLFVFAFAPDVLVQWNIYPQDTMKQAVINYQFNVDQTEFVNTLQETFDCCGVSNDDQGYKDWNDNQYYNCTTKELNPSSLRCSVPFTCCKVRLNLQCGANALDEAQDNKDINKVGCLKGLVTYLQNNLYLILGIVLGVLVPQIIFIQFARNLNSQIELQLLKWKRSQYAQNYSR